jgi:hypothetical protein
MSFSTPSPHRLNDFATDLVLANPNPCGNCGPWPCYHICPNSPHYYSAEQERYDDANYDRSEYYREGGFIDVDYYDEDTYRAEEEAANAAADPALHSFETEVPPYDDTDDLPF